MIVDRRRVGACGRGRRLRPATAVAVVLGALRGRTSRYGGVRDPREAGRAADPRDRERDGRRRRAARPAARPGVGRSNEQVLVVCPALNSPLKHWVSDEDGARAAAQERLDASLARLRRAGSHASGEVGDSEPLQALEDALRTLRRRRDRHLDPSRGPLNWLEGTSSGGARALRGPDHPRGRRPRTRARRSSDGFGGLEAVYAADRQSHDAHVALYRFQRVVRDEVDGSAAALTAGSTRRIRRGLRLHVHAQLLRPRGHGWQVAVDGLGVEPEAFATSARGADAPRPAPARRRVVERTSRSRRSAARSGARERRHPAAALVDLLDDARERG